MLAGTSTGSHIVPPANWIAGAAWVSLTKFLRSSSVA